LLRGLGIILSVCFFLRIVGGLRNNLEEIAGEMELRPKPERLLRQLTGIQKDILTFWKWFGSLFHTFRRNNRTARNVPLDVKVAWRTYVGRERIWPRCILAALYTALMIAFFLYVLAPIFGMAMNPPARGTLAFGVYFWTTMGDILCMDFLTFFVFDTTLSCLLFVNKLRRAQSLWPQATLAVYDALDRESFVKIGGEKQRFRELRPQRPQDQQFVKHIAAEDTDRFYFLFLSFFIRLSPEFVVDLVELRGDPPEIIVLALSNWTLKALSIAFDLEKSGELPCFSPAVADLSCFVFSLPALKGRRPSSPLK
jgi:hypothetical protein